jgi:hypothetical protein
MHMDGAGDISQTELGLVFYVLQGGRLPHTEEACLLRGHSGPCATDRSNVS